MGKNDLYVVTADAFGGENQVICSPRPKADADMLADRLKDTMKNVDKDFQAFSNIKVKKADIEPHYMDNLEKNDYNYSVLDDLDKKIAKGSNGEWKIKDERNNVEKIKKVKFKNK